MSAWQVWRLSRQAFERGNFHEAIRYSKETIAIANDRQQPYLELMALEDIAIAYGNLSEEREAIRYATRLMIRAKQVKDKKFQMCGGLRMVESMASLDLRRKWGELEPILQEGLQIARELNDTWYVIYHLTRLGIYSAKTGELELGIDYLQQALSLVTPFINKSNYFYTEIYSYMAYIRRKQGKLDDAAQYATMAVTHAIKHGNPNFICEAELFAAEVRVERGDYNDVLPQLERLRLTSERNQWLSEAQHASYLLSKTYLNMELIADAIDAARKALALAQQLEQAEEEVISLIALGHVLLADDQTDTARDILLQAQQLSQSRGYDDYETDATALLDKLPDEF